MSKLARRLRIDREVLRMKKQSSGRGNVMRGVA